MRERLATLISGGGTTMQRIIQASQSGEISMDIACVISSSRTAGGIEKAKHFR
jgi:folate-dependent phosphoribosylglycinamide formyltransferase PurN